MKTNMTNTEIAEEFFQVLVPPQLENMRNRCAARAKKAAAKPGATIVTIVEAIHATPLNPADDKEYNAIAA